MEKLGQNISKLLIELPESEELLYPYLKQTDDTTTISQLSDTFFLKEAALISGIQRISSRASHYACNYKKMKQLIIKEGCVNIAGFTSFLWQQDFVTEMRAYATKENIPLNINIFPKHIKKEFQNYLAQCNSIDDLPDVLIGKGFSSLMTPKFLQKFVLSGYFKNTKQREVISSFFKATNITDDENHYHPFGIEEMVMLQDHSVPLPTKVPEYWSDLIKPEYKNSFTHNGKNNNDHFGFNIMLHLYLSGGEEYIRKYVDNLKYKQHFSTIIKNIGSAHSNASPINIVHQYAGLLVRSRVKEKTEIVKTTDGNPATCLFYLLKRNADDRTINMVNHLYNDKIKTIMEKNGTTHISSNRLLSNADKLQWPGWNVIKELNLPYLKEYLSGIAYNTFQTL